MGTEADKPLDKNVLGEMLTALADSFQAERQKEQPYKELFKAGSSFTRILRELDTQMSGHVLDACDIIKERLGVEVNRSQYNLLLALPLLVHIAEKDAERNEGMACCVDKAFFMLSEEFKKLGEGSNPPEDEPNSTASNGPTTS